MLKKIMKAQMLLICFLGLIGCAPEVEVGYQPIGVPVRVSISGRGEIRAGFSGAFVTPVGWQIIQERVEQFFFLINASRIFWVYH